MNKSSGNVELSYAYSKSKSDEIGVATISLVIGNDELLLLVEVNEDIAQDDFEKLLTNLQSQPFNKMQLSITKDCNVVLVQPTGEYAVSFEKVADNIKIVGMIPVER